MYTVILLASDGNCGNAAAVAFYLHHAFSNTLQGFKIKLYNYVTGRLHTYQANQLQNAFDAGVPLTDAAFYRDVCQDLGTPTNAPGGAISSATFDRLGGYTTYSDSMTTLDRSRVPQQLVTRACGVIDQLLAINGDTKCFVIAPNGRNIPSRLLTFGHKLSYDTNQPAIYQYKKRHGGNFATPHLVMTNGDTSASMTEILLCQAITLNDGARYLGNCYGSQIMWVALGGGLTTFKRQQGAQHNQTMVLNHDPEQSNDPFIPNVNWNDGVYLGNNQNRHPVCIISGGDRHPLLGQYGGDIEYNTDYHHSFMLIASKKLARRANEIDLFTLGHDLAGVVSSSQQGNQQHIVRVKRYAQSPVDNYPDDDDPRQNRTWEWLGLYTCHGHRIYGFQGHPLYHITQYSSAWNAQAPSVNQGPTSSLNTQQANTLALVQRCLFG